MGDDLNLRAIGEADLPLLRRIYGGRAEICGSSTGATPVRTRSSRSSSRPSTATTINNFRGRHST